MSSSIRTSCWEIDRPWPREAGIESPFRYPEEDGTGAFYWWDERFACVIAAKAADRDLLLGIAEIVYQQTSPDSAKAKLPPAPDKAS